MGKHKNTTQIRILLEFMEENQYLAKGFSKKDKALVESLWQQLTANLNAAGPPKKDAVGWRKVWSDWKSDVKKKLAQNKIEGRATGGGPYSKHQLNPTEEAIVRLCGITKAVQGVPGMECGVEEDTENAKNEFDIEIPSTSTRRCETLRSSNTPKRLRPEHISMRLSKFLDDDDEHKKELSDNSNELIIVTKENGSSLRRIYRAIEKSNDSVAKAVTELKDELKIANDLKKQQLELELSKFDFEKYKN